MCVFIWSLSLLARRQSGLLPHLRQQPHGGSTVALSPRVDGRILDGVGVICVEFLAWCGGGWLRGCESEAVAAAIGAVR